MSRNKNSNLSSNIAIRDAIQKISRHGLVNPHTNTVRGSEKITGYVAKIHTEGELAGTIDVQEYTTLATHMNNAVKGGYHEGVRLSAIQDGSKGLFIVPKMYSEVVVTTDPATFEQYVTMFSHVDVIQLDSHETITVGVQEREEYQQTEDDITVDQLKPTGVYSKTTYSKNSITTEIQGEGEANHTSQRMDGTKIEAVVGDNKSSSTLTQDEIRLTHDKAETILNDSQSILQFGSSKVQVEDGTVYVGNKSNVDDAVLGGELASILSELVGYIGKIITTTMMGPQPPINVADFIALKAKIDMYKSSHGGFLTKKVQIQK